jgi:hypothetical protein
MRPEPAKRAPADEPADHAIGRSRGGLTTKIHLAADGNCRPLAFVLTAGQAGDAPAFLKVMARLRVPRGQGRPRTRPNAVLADKAYSSRAIREHLRRRGIRTVILVPADQRSHRLRRGSRGGRPHLTVRRTNSATPSSGPSTASSSGAASPPATRRPPRSTWPGSTSQASSSGPLGDPHETARRQFSFGSSGGQRKIPRVESGQKRRRRPR